MTWLRSIRGTNTISSGRPSAGEAGPPPTAAGWSAVVWAVNGTATPQARKNAVTTHRQLRPRMWIPPLELEINGKLELPGSVRLYRPHERAECVEKRAI